MKVYFCGSHCVGKSTLARYVSKEHSLPMLTEVARMVLAEQELYLDSLRGDLSATNSYQKAVFDRQLEEERKYTNFVSDRSLIDCLAYTANHTSIFANLIHSDIIKGYVEDLRKKDTFLFLVKPTKTTLKQDGVRETISWEGIIKIDSMIKMMLEMFEIDYFQIDTDNMQERVKLVNSILKRLKQ